MNNFEILNIDEYVTMKVLGDNLPKAIYYYLKNINISESFISKLRKSTQNILVNDKPSRVVDKIKAGDILKFKCDFFEDKKDDNVQISNKPIDIVYEDDLYLIVNKPSGLSSIPSRSHFDDNLLARIKNYYFNKNSKFIPRLLNRLDFDTSGLVVFAKNLLACSFSGSGNYNNCFDKTYFAICNGRVQNDLKINREILTKKYENGINIRRREVGEINKNICTFARPIKYLENHNLTLLEIKIIGGKTHQIRCHLSSLGFPLLGDKLYGDTSNLEENTMLVCKCLEFINPLNNQKIQLKIDYENKFKKYFK